MGFHRLVNTALFSEAANDFHRNHGFYTTAPRGSRDYFEYWEEQEKRCRLGYKVGDLWIPGRMYFYLNFFPIWKVPNDVIAQALKEAKDKKGKMLTRTANKVFDFPKFWEVHYEWWNFKQIAWHGGQFMGIHSPGGKHIGVAKARGAGWSYLEAADGVYNYNFIDGSKSYYFAGTQAYLDQDGILNKVQPGLDWINDHIPYWKKNRQKKYGLMHQKASYLDEFGVERGSLSEIIGQVVDDPNKTRGKRGRKITFEEGGSFPKMKEALEISLGSMRDGSLYVGQITVLGTGGEEGPGIEGLEDVFYDPASWDMLEFPNVWEEGYEGTTCGYFVPSWRANSVFMDDDGNVEAKEALAADNVVRDQKKKSKDPRSLDRRVAEYPQKPGEAFQRLSFNMFPVADINEQIRKVMNDSAIKALIRHGKLIRKSTGVTFIPDYEGTRPVWEYPHKKGDDLTGAITIYEQPFHQKDGHVPGEIYSLVVDPFYKEESDDLTSLFVVYVIKHYNYLDPVSEGLIVASYIGRPASLRYAYEQLFMLSDYYGAAKIQSEVAGGGQGIIDYARDKRLLERLEYEPEMLHNKDYYKAAKNRSIFMNMPMEKKRLGLTYLADWTKFIRGHDQNGNPILNIHRIYDLGFLQEMKRFNDKGNFDRISAMLLAMFMLKERVAISAETMQEESEFYNRQLFGASTSNDETLTTYA
jgi:hypothetical protein